MSKRILLKLSGEALSGDKGVGFDFEVCQDIARQLKELTQAGTRIAIVIGGGNFWRGRTGKEIDRCKADSIGMLATVMNCIYVSDVCRNNGLKTSVFNSFVCGDMVKLFSKDEVMESFEKNELVFLAGGTGHPYFSTDTGAILRAIEIEADEILLAKAIDGVYDKDPATDKTAKKFDTISLQEIVQRGLQVVDMTASVLAMENKIPMLVFKLNEKNSIINAMKDNSNGTVVTV